MSSSLSPTSLTLHVNITSWNTSSLDKKAIARICGHVARHHCPADRPRRHQLTDFFAWRAQPDYTGLSFICFYVKCIETSSGHFNAASEKWSRCRTARVWTQRDTKSTFEPHTNGHDKQIMSDFIPNLELNSVFTERKLWQKSIPVLWPFKWNLKCNLLSTTLIINMQLHSEHYSVFLFIFFVNFYGMVHYALFRKDVLKLKVLGICQLLHVYNITFIIFCFFNRCLVMSPPLQLREGKFLIWICNFSTESP